MCIWLNYGKMQDNLNDCQKSLILNVEACANPTDDDDEQEDFVEHYTNDENLLDIEYRLSSSGDLKSVELTLGFGGPNIYLDTGTAYVTGYWGGDEYSQPVDRSECNQITEYYEGLMPC